MFISSTKTCWNLLVLFLNGQQYLGWPLTLWTLVQSKLKSQGTLWVPCWPWPTPSVSYWKPQQRAPTPPSTALWRLRTSCSPEDITSEFKINPIHLTHTQSKYIQTQALGLFDLKCFNVTDGCCNSHTLKVLNQLKWKIVCQVVSEKHPSCCFFSPSWNRDCSLSESCKAGQDDGTALKLWAVSCHLLGIRWR